MVKLTSPYYDQTMIRLGFSILFFCSQLCLAIVYTEATFEKTELGRGNPGLARVEALLHPQGLGLERDGTRVKAP